MVFFLLMLLSMVGFGVVSDPRKCGASRPFAGVMICAECSDALALAATEGTVEAEAVAEGDMCMWCADVNREDNGDLLLCDECDKVR